MGIKSTTKSQRRFMLGGRDDTLTKIFLTVTYLFVEEIVCKLLG